MAKDVRVYDEGVGGGVSQCGGVRGTVAGVVVTSRLPVPLENLPRYERSEARYVLSCLLWICRVMDERTMEEMDRD